MLVYFLKLMFERITLETWCVNITERVFIGVWSRSFSLSLLLDMNWSLWTLWNNLKRTSLPSTNLELKQNKVPKRCTFKFEFQTNKKTSGVCRDGSTVKNTGYSNRELGLVPQST